MKEQLISFEVAKLAKEKGFFNGSKTVFIDYTDGSKTEYYDDYYTVNNKKGLDLSNETWIVFEAPTQSLLQKWLWEKHKIWVEITLWGDSIGFTCMIKQQKDEKESYLTVRMLTMIEAQLGDYDPHIILERGLFEALKWVK